MKRTGFVWELLFPNQLTTFPFRLILTNFASWCLEPYEKPECSYRLKWDSGRTVDCFLPLVWLLYLWQRFVFPKFSCSQHPLQRHNQHCKLKTAKTLLGFVGKLIFFPTNHHQSLSRIFGGTPGNMLLYRIISQEEAFIDMHCREAFQHSLYIFLSVQWLLYFKRKIRTLCAFRSMTAISNYFRDWIISMHWACCTSTFKDNSIYTHHSGRQ